jgi:hypothetical protein
MKGIGNKQLAISNKKKQKAEFFSKRLVYSKITKSAQSKQSA